MDEIVRELLLNTGALGVWVFRSTMSRGNDLQNEVLASATRHSAILSPLKVFVEGETYLDFGDMQLFAQPVADAGLVLVFDDGSSLGLVRMRVRHAKESIERALVAPK